MANFVGHINFVEGNVADISGEEMLFRTAHGDLKIQPSYFEVSPGDKLEAVVRPKSIGIARPDRATGSDAKVIEGHIESGMYIGAIMRYTVAAGDQTIYVDESDPQYKGILNEGDKAHLVSKHSIPMLKV
ncbi:MAG: TOBE domain-containing protein [bacterium]|nr:TOBE domain-containing protein [bacterium]